MNHGRRKKNDPRQKVSWKVVEIVIDGPDMG
jgi:hypothetical protein